MTAYLVDDLQKMRQLEDLNLFVIKPNFTCIYMEWNLDVGAVVKLTASILGNQHGIKVASKIEKVELTAVLSRCIIQKNRPVLERLWKNCLSSKFYQESIDDMFGS